MADRLYRIGELASRTGLSVRALRHSDAEGLLPPASRTPAGHRLYSAADIERLQRIVSLRALGLPLAEVRAALGTADPLEVVERHLAHVRAQIAAQARLAERLETLAGQLRHLGTAASTESLFDLITLTTMFDTHYTPEQLEALKARAEAVGPDRIAEVQREWNALYARATKHMQAGLDPAGPEMQALARKAEALVGEFTGGDSGIRQSLKRAVQTDAAAMYDAWGVPPDLGAYYSRAMAALHASRV